IITKAQEVALLGCGESVGEGWYRRFKELFPVLTGRTAQALSLKRNCIVPADLTMIFNTLAKLVIELKLDGSRVFNMDETAFQKQLKSKKVVAVKGSSNVWSTEPTANFHLTIVACGSAAGFVVPPAFILPGKTVSSQLLENCEAPGAAVSTSPSGFMNTELFEVWLQFFADAVPDSVQRPLVLILDGCASHYSAKVVDAAAHFSILLVFLPPNGTHLLQPLDVAVFSTLKNKIRNLIGELVEEEDSGYYSISKEDAIAVAGMAWRGAKISRNIERGFKACGLYPLSLVKMGSRLDAFARNGAPRHVQLAAWLQMREIVHDEVLTLPAPPHKDSSTKRKRVSVGGRLLTHDVLQELGAGKAKRSSGARKKSKHVQLCVPTGCDIIES
ncbi:hypothetical protein PR001_g31691, partial [Phytophthora rubi]